MADLTPEEIVLAIQAEKVWTFAPGDIMRRVVHADGRHYASGPFLLQHIDDAGTMRFVGMDAMHMPVRDARSGTVDFGPGMSIRGWTYVPDPTARGFVSAGLAQVRERTGEPRAYIECDADRLWGVWTSAQLLAEGSTDMEAVVAALEATHQP